MFRNGDRKSIKLKIFLKNNNYKIVDDTNDTGSNYGEDKIYWLLINCSDDRIEECKNSVFTLV